MIGFLIGAVCLFGLARVLRAGQRHRHHARFFGMRGALRRLFERLDTSPGQEKVILAAVEDLWQSRRALRDEIVASRQDLAQVMRGDTFDHAALDEAFARHDALKATLRDDARRTLEVVHDALDARQRTIVGDLLDGGSGFGFARGFGGRCPLHGADARYTTPSPDAQTPYRGEWV